MKLSTRNPPEVRETMGSCFCCHFRQLFDIFILKTILVQSFCPLKTEIPRFSIRFGFILALVEFVTSSQEMSGLSRLQFVRHAHQLRELIKEPPTAMLCILAGLNIKLKRLCFQIFSYRYSRKILWLEVAHTNNDPCVVGNYFVECVEQIGGQFCFSEITLFGLFYS